MKPASVDPNRPKFEAALTHLQAMPSKAGTSLVTEFLPRYVETLRTLGYGSREAEKIIQKLDLGEVRITVRLIREWWVKAHERPTGRARARNPDRGARQTPSATPSTPTQHGAFLRDRRTL